MGEIARLNRTQLRKTNAALTIRGVRLNSLNPKRMDHDEFKTILSTVTVRECQLVLTLRSGGLNQDEILFFDRALSDPRAIDAVFELLLQRMTVPPTKEPESEHPETVT